MPLLSALSRRPAPHRPTATAVRRPLAVAHRGASVRAPENTVSAVGCAVDLGADLVEVDVQRSSDGVLVCLHDSTLRRTTDVADRFPARADAPVGSFTAAELTRLDAGSWHPAGTPEPIATLAAVLDRLAGTRTGLLLELKSPRAYPGVVADVVELLALGPAVPVVVQSFHVLAVKELASRAPQVPVGVLGHPPRGHLPVLASWAHQVNPPYRRLTEGYVDAVHRAGLECLTWTLDDESAVRRALRMGVDGVISNRPDLVASLSAPTDTADRGGSAPWRRRP